MTEKKESEVYSGETKISSVKFQKANVILSQTLIINDDDPEENDIDVDLIPGRKVTFKLRKSSLGENKHIDLNLISSDEENKQVILIKHSGAQGLLGATKKRSNLYIRSFRDEDRGVDIFREQISFSFSLEKKGEALFFNMIFYSERL